MSMIDGVQQAATRPQTPAANNERIKIFISYAHEDEDIKAAVAQSLDRLNTLSNSYIRTLYDEKSLDPGTPATLLSDISDKLLESDYLVILYTGALKKSYSWTGAELGIFWGFIRTDVRDYGQSKRQIVAIYFDEKPPVDWGALELQLGISPLDLQLPRDQYLTRIVQAIRTDHRYDQLINTFRNIGAAADARLPAQSGAGSMSPGEWQEYLERRSNSIKDSIVPDLMAALHDSLSRRVKIANVEQRLIQFRIPKAVDTSDAAAPLPDDTVLDEHGDAFSLFQVGGAGGSTTWGTFKSALQRMPEAPWIIASIERSVISAISPDIARDDEQIVRAPDTESIFRLIVTRRLQYFDGTEVVDMYFIPALPFAFLENSRIGITLGYINVAVKYREVFLDPTASLGVRDYYRKFEFSQLQAKVRRSIRELQIVEEESHTLKLDEWESIAVYLGCTIDDAKAAGRMQGEWDRVRKALMTAAQVLLKTSSTDGDAGKQQASDAWVAALNDFVEVSDSINSETLRRAMDNLKLYVFGAAQPDIPHAVAANDAEGLPAQATRQG